MQYGKGSDPEADLFWESLAHKTWSWRLEVSEPQDLRVVIKAAIYRGRGKKCLQVNVLQPAGESRNLPFKMRVWSEQSEKIPPFSCSSFIYVIIQIK